MEKDKAEGIKDKEGSVGSLGIEEAVPEVVYHKVDVGPMPVIDYEEDAERVSSPRVSKGATQHPSDDVPSLTVGLRTRADADPTSPKGTKIIAQGKAAGRDPGSGGDAEPLPEGEQQTDDGPDLFVEVPTGQRLAVPKQFFGEMWQSGELAVLLGAPGTGKSVLAVQIADALARGKPLAVDGEKSAEEQLAVSSKQSAEKKSAVSSKQSAVKQKPDSLLTAHGLPLTTTHRSGPTANRSLLTSPQHVLYFDLVLDETQFAMRYSLDAQPGDERLRKPHRFSSRFRRFQIDLCVDKPENVRRMQDFVLKQIEKIIVRTGARVAVIDSLDRFNFGLMRNGDLGHVMSGLLRLKRRLGLSLLVVANAPRSRPDKPLAADRLLATRTICSYADNVFAVGHCRWADEVRYVKHLRSRSHDVVLNESFVPSYSLSKSGETFLSFEFAEFRPESVHLDAYMDRHRLDRIDECRRLRGQGLKQRQIAAKLKMSLAAVSRALHNWTTSEMQAEPPASAGGLVSKVSSSDNFSKTAEQSSKYGHSVRDASRIYLENLGIDTSAIGGLPQRTAAGVGSPRVSKGATQLESNIAPSLTVGLPTHVSTSPAEKAGPLEASNFRPSFDGYGREIWIEKETNSGQPLVWYLYDSTGNIRKAERLTYNVLWSKIPREEFKPPATNHGSTGFYK